MEILGIDVGGTGIKGAIVNVKTGELISEKHRIPTPKGAKPKDVADKVAEKEGVEDGYRLVLNNGVGAGQLVMHVHFHLLAGRSLTWPPG